MDQRKLMDNANTITDMAKVRCPQKKKKLTEEKAKVSPAVWGTEFLAAPGSSGWFEGKDYQKNERLAEWMLQKNG